jgi:hypothetical protein
MVAAMLPAVEEVLPSPVEVRPWSRLRAALRRIDGWGPLAWKEILGGWQLPAGVLAITTPEYEAGDDEDRRVLFLAIDHGLGAGAPVAAADQVAIADWVLRQTWETLLAKPLITAWTLRPGSAVRASNACWCEGTRLILRLEVLLPYAGMCIDAKRCARFLQQVAAFAADVARPQLRPALASHCRALRLQRAMRAALPEHGLCAFIAEGSILPRAADGGPFPGAAPVRIPPSLQVTLDLGRLGKIAGWGIPKGVTALTGAPYHGKSTVLQALQAGIDDHPPGDGRERVVTDSSALLVQAEDGRAIKDQDLSGFFAALPGADSTHFSTSRASGATSMAASVLQGVAAGCHLLLVDEDTAASNFLLIDPVLRRLLGRTLHGNRTLLEVLPALAAQGVSTILVAGSNGHALAVADRVVQLDHWQPHDVTRRARRLTGPRPTAPRAWSVGRRWLAADPDAVFGARHFVPCDLREPERPQLKLPVERGHAPVWQQLSAWHQLDLRRSGWVLDAPLVAGALAAAGWCCRLAPQGADLAALEQQYHDLVARGATALDPYHTRLMTVPPWQLVVAVLERLPVPRIAGGEP